ncbi:MAG: hypothetical protein ABI051_07285 [Vicinamibacterales bacterium]
MRKGPLPFDEAFDYFWVVEPQLGSYSVVVLTGSDSDAIRVRRMYERRGLTVPLERIRERLIKSREQLTRLRLTGVSAATSIGVPASRHGVTLTDALETPGSEPATIYCTGGAEVREEAWEPARWIWNVDELARTTFSTTWERDETDIYPDSQGQCWANQLTFFYTSWQVTSCGVNIDRRTNYFDDYTYGEYLNYDFMFNSVTTTIWSQAGVQFTNGAAYWHGYTSSSGEWGYWSWYPYPMMPFISGHTFGFATDTCN